MASQPQSHSPEPTRASNLFLSYVLGILSHVQIALPVRISSALPHIPIASPFLASHRVQGESFSGDISLFAIDGFLPRLQSLLLRRAVYFLSRNGYRFQFPLLSLYISLVPMVLMAATAPITNARGISKERANSRILVAHHQRGKPFSSASHTLTAHPQHGRRWTVPISTLTTSRSYSCVLHSSKRRFLLWSLILITDTYGYLPEDIVVLKDDPTFAEHLQQTCANVPACISASADPCCSTDP